MKSVRIRTLQRTDAQALLKFEVDNREWFERHIDARGAAFYSVQGVTDHIREYLAEHAAGTWHPFVIEEDGGRIVGRANLKAIDTSARTAEVGYRIAQSACGRGLATQAVKHLIREAQRRWNLTHLMANVYVENIASTKVLERCGFLVEPVSRHEGTDREYRFGLSMQASV
ncbi:hypothetical protein PS662_05393 [Pseudomonas fluorescens]|uniref:N-acetyltransferase domain-containing protein n=1 Tax=Pseudomonas fluorescens TaxID=294 RepID=A0A5E6XG12_PSEFL|nr:GNAT family N-acetyltransferase [Pseudomonas fluorescens]VVN39846.1 hypothetical protein PS662_05393 [Pseudomonas fluorescens]